MALAVLRCSFWVPHWPVAMLSLTGPIFTPMRWVSTIWALSTIVLFMSCCTSRFAKMAGKGVGVQVFAPPYFTVMQSNKRYWWVVGVHHFFIRNMCSIEVGVHDIGSKYSPQDLLYTALN